MALRSSTLLVALIAAALGCGDNLRPLDASTLDAPSPDAPLDAPAIDAPDPDAPIDAAIDTVPIDAAIDAPPGGPITVVVTYGQHAWQVPPHAPAPPLADVPVIVTRPDGSPGARGTTGTDGRVTLTAEPGAWVTVVLRGETPTHPTFLKTIAGVEPGDELAFFHPARFSALSFTEPYTYQWPAPPAGSSNVHAADRCGAHSAPSGATSLAVRSRPHCTAPSAVLLRAYGGPNGPDDFSYAYLPSVARVPGETYAAGAWQPAGTLPITVTQLPAGANGWLFAIPLLDGEVAEGPSPFHNLVQTAGVSTVQPAWAPPVTRAFVSMNYLRFPGFAEQSDEVWTDVDGPLAFSAADLLPFITSPPMIDHATRTVIWSQTPGALPDGVEITQSAGRGPWQMLVPPGAPSYVFPTLPADLADLLPPSTGTGFPDVSLLAYDSIPSYRAMRNLPEGGRLMYRREHGAQRALHSRWRD